MADDVTSQEDSELHAPTLLVPQESEFGAEAPLPADAVDPFVEQPSEISKSKSFLLGTVRWLRPAMDWVIDHRRESAAALIVIMMSAALFDSRAVTPVVTDADYERDLIEVEKILADFSAAEAPPFGASRDESNSAIAPSTDDTALNAIPGTSESTDGAIRHASALQQNFGELPPPAAAMDDRSGIVSTARAGYGNLSSSDGLVSDTQAAENSAVGPFVQPATTARPVRISPIRFRGGIQPVP